MVPKMLRLAPLIGLALLLTACQITVIPYDPIVAATIDAQDSTSPTPRRSNVSIAPGETLVYEVRVPVARDLLYGEAAGNGRRVRWVARFGFTRAASRTPRWFAPAVAALSGSAADPSAAGDAGVGASAAELGPRSVAVHFQCFGPCAAISPSSGRYYLEVRNQSPSTQVFDLFVYTFAANDLNDRGSSSNDTAATATPFGPGDSPSGAIELVGDVDWFRYTGFSERVLRFAVRDEAVGLVLQFEDGFTVEGTTAGLNTTVRANERFRVYSASGRAGPSDTSGYAISLP